MVIKMRMVVVGNDYSYGNNDDKVSYESALSITKPNFFIASRPCLLSPLFLAPNNLYIISQPTACRRQLKIRPILKSLKMCHVFDLSC